VATNRLDTGLVGRDDLLAEISALLRQRRNVLLFGPQDIGKTAIIGAFAEHDVTFWIHSSE
jgi:MoxR-like ATPase